MIFLRLIISGIIGIFLMSGIAIAKDLGCHQAVRVAEEHYAIKPGILTAISQVESGMDPLAINGDGRSYHPRSVQEAVSLVYNLQRRGVRFIDVGCMQIDLFYHPEAFASLYDAFNPAINAEYGASFLASRYASTGNWGEAIAGYHAKDPVRKMAYLRQVEKHLHTIIPKQNEERYLHQVTVKLSFMTIARDIVSDDRER